jgi:hypothetical protein
MNRILSIAVLGICLVAPALVCGEEIKPEDVEFFEKHVRPVLAERCFECHSAEVDEPDAGLRLDSAAAVLQGGDSGAVLVAGDVENSRLLRAVSYDDVDLQMPPDGKLPDETLEHLREWVRRGAPWPADPATDKVEDAPKRAGFDLAARKASHWAWQPVQPQSPPEVQHQDWPRTDVDRFLLAKLEAAGHAPAAEADRRTWIRRVTFDLIGLPPSVSEINAFLADETPEAHAKVVDRLLASQHFGEHWARHWLDLVRYAETKGHEFDYHVPNAWQYRDYVIRALNSDIPYDQFVVEHIAGDLLPSPRMNREQAFNESILGAGFWCLGEEVHSPVDTRQDQADRFDNRIDVFSKTFLGLTVACARCHDHKFDAISARDYYALFGILEGSTNRLARFDTIERDRQIATELDAVDRAAQLPLRRAVAEALLPGVEQLEKTLLAAIATTPIEGTDGTIVAAWRDQLQAAQSDPSHALHQLAHQLLTPETVASADCGVPALSESAAEVIVDYAKLQPNQWLPDEVGYGLHPVLAGEARINTDGAMRFTERTAARFDRAWDARTLAPGQQLESGLNGRVVRPGRTLCTPNFTLREGTKVYYLVRGAGQVYAAVDQNALIHGPLHTTLVQSIDTAGAWQWIERDLTYYANHLTHLEFTPNEAGQMAVAAVVQAEQPSQLPAEPFQVFAPNAGASTAELAAELQRHFAQILNRLDSESFLTNAEASQDAQLANWTLQHPELFAHDATALTSQLEPAIASYAALRSAILAKIQPESRLCVTLQDVSGVDSRVFLRGSPKNLGDVVPRRGPEAIFGPDTIADGASSGRLELAQQMVDPSRNPLLARVMVNRIWHHLFGRGIVGSVDNFGVMGDQPTHPELLDYLAARFVSEGWSTKRLIRELTLTSAYRTASTGDAAAETADPENLLLHRMRVRRLQGETIRDAMLAVSGDFDRTLYGPSIPIHLNEFMDGRGRPGASGPLDGANRRSLYVEIRRNFLSPLMLAFDMPIPFSTVGRRNVSNVPAQSLVLLNDPLVHELAHRWATRICAEQQAPSARVDAMYLEAFGRAPSNEERERCLAYVAAQESAAWQSLAHALWNVKEFVFVY